MTAIHRFIRNLMTATRVRAGQVITLSKPISSAVRLLRIQSDCPFSRVKGSQFEATD